MSHTLLRLLVLLGTLLPGRATNAPPRLVLADLEWQRNGADGGPAPVEVGAGGTLLRASFDALGTRWSARFQTETAGTRRLWLEWEPASDGLLFEVVLDGERLPPPRDGWRPRRRVLRSDLGPRWLGAGSHLLEFVAREQPAGEGVLRLAVLELGAP